MIELLGEKTVETKTPDKWWFIAEQLLFLAKETYVTKPDDPSYQFSRRIAEGLLSTSYKVGNELVKEGLSIGVYNGVELLLKKLFKK